LPDGKLALLDTSVYIENFRTGRFTLPLLRSPWIIRCSAIVLHELRRGARTALEIRFVTELARKIRIVTPTERHWLESAEILSRLRTLRGYEPKKITALAFDALIALSARDIGATLITCNREDFTEIGKQIQIKIAYW
jgi:predicted nucleic acid-binding protein